MKPQKNILTLEGTGNDGYRYRYEFEKDEKFKDGFLGFMGDLGFKNDRDLGYLFEDYGCEKGINGEVKVESINQKLENFRNKNFDVDVIFFEKEIEIIVRTKKTKELIKSVNKWFKFLGE